LETEGWEETEEFEERAERVEGSHRRETFAERRAEARLGHSVERRDSWMRRVSAALHAAV